MALLRSDLRGGLLVLVGAVLWSTGGVCVKVLDGYGPVAISSGRSVISALFFLLLLRGRIGIPKGMGRWIGVGTVTYAAVVMSFVAATRFTTAANAILLQYTSPLWIAFLGWLVIRERPSGRELLAMGIGGAGVVFCASEGLTLFFQSRSVSRAMLGDALALGSGLCFALVTVILRITSKRAAEATGPQTGGGHAESSTTSSCTAPSPGNRPPGNHERVGFSPASSSAASAPSASLVCLFYGNALAALIGAPALARDFPNPGVTGHAWIVGLAVLLWLGGGQLGGGYWFFQRGLQTTRALTASLLGLIEPVLNPVFAALIVGEMPSKGTRIGGVLVLISVILSLTGRRRVG